MIYEAHVIVDPLYGRKMDHFSLICKENGFEVVENTLCSGSDASLEDLSFNLGNLVLELQVNDIHVWRYKLEETIIDSDIVDKYKLLKKDNNGRL